MSDMYLLVSSDGCAEVGGDVVSTWFSNIETARHAYKKSLENGKESSRIQAETINESEHLMWTSSEYYCAMLFKFPAFGFTGAKPSTEYIRALNLLVYAEPSGLGHFVVDLDGGRYFEDGHSEGWIGVDDLDDYVDFPTIAAGNDISYETLANDLEAFEESNGVGPAPFQDGIKDPSFNYNDFVDEITYRQRGQAF